jgi:TPR repeat protein
MIMKAQSCFASVSLGLFVVFTGLAAPSQSQPPDPFLEAHKKGDLVALRKLGEAGDLRAQKSLVIVYLAGALGQKPDSAEAFRWEKMAASQGDPESAARVGFAYLHGDSEIPVAKDPKAAAGWLMKAGNAGHVQACRSLADLLLSGAEGVPWDPAESMHWRILGEDAADLERAWNYATRYRVGYETDPKDPREGVLRLMNAVQTRAEPRELVCMGIFYLRGPADFPKNPTDGFRLIALAAEKGDWEALMYLARTHRYGVGVPKNPAEARTWLQKAAALGHPTAQAWLGEMMIDGEGGARDFAAAEPLLRAAYDVHEPVAGPLMRARIGLAILATKDPARKPPIGDVVWPTARDKGARAAEDQYRELLANHRDEYDFSEDWLNYVGYRLLDARRVQDAADIFRLNTLAFPDSWNVWDSLAEAQALLGQLDEAIANYRKSVALNPENTAGAAHIARLEKAKAEAAAAPAADDWDDGDERGQMALSDLARVLGPDIDAALAVVTAEKALLEAAAALRSSREKSGAAQQSGATKGSSPAASGSPTTAPDEATARFNAAKARLLKAYEARKMDGQAALLEFAQKNGFKDLLQETTH